ncbi:MAG: rhodanese-like domain-containing protein [Saprospiraceae bacterium]|nr:rhodanese-like domain-containing protein [Saprospiraceae bacterium]MCB9322784.1 rhodanese-like domain-containing protein [Lewinellaceae bacterium]
MEKTVCKTSFWSLLKAQLNNLNPEEFASMLSQDPAAVLIDVRSPEEFTLGSFPGALNINYSSGDLWDQLEALDKNRKIFVFCRSGRRSIRVCTLLKNGGFDEDEIFNLDGGLNSFQKYYDFELNKI